ncbi:MAG: glycosyltransferase family 39 protein [Elusimicrobiota bacterium]
MSIASGIISGKGYGETWRPPGYATFLGIIFFFFGKSIFAVRIINSLLGSLTCILIYLIGKKIFSPLIGKISAILLCTYPYLIAYTGDLISETFYTFLIALSVFFILSCGENPNLKKVILTGFILGVTALTKSTILPFFFFACGWLWWRTKNIKIGFLVGIFTLLTILPWILRNYIYYKQFILVSPGYQTLWIANNDKAMVIETSGEQDSPMGLDWDYIPSTHQEILKLPKMQSEKIFKDESINWIKNNPEKFKWLVKRRLIHFWRLYPMMAYKWQKIIAIFTSGIYIPLCFVGIILSIQNFKKTSLLIFLFIIYTLIHLPFGVTLRYRIPIDAYIIIFASYTIHFIWIKLKSFISSRV